jgi:hypothetical protein
MISRTVPKRVSFATSLGPRLRPGRKQRQGFFALNAASPRGNLVAFQRGVQRCHTPTWLFRNHPEGLEPLLGVYRWFGLWDAASNPKQHGM